MKYYIDNNAEVTERIEKKTTIIVFGSDWEAEKEAKEVARRLNSCHFEVFTKKIGSDKLIHIGYGIPK